MEVRPSLIGKSPLDCWTPRPHLGTHVEVPELSCLTGYENTHVSYAEKGLIHKVLIGSSTSVALSRRLNWSLIRLRPPSREVPDLQDGQNRLNGRWVSFPNQRDLGSKEGRNTVLGSPNPDIFGLENWVTTHISHYHDILTFHDTQGGLPSSRRDKISHCVIERQHFYVNPDLGGELGFNLASSSDQVDGVEVSCDVG